MNNSEEIPPEDYLFLIGVSAFFGLIVGVIIASFGSFFIGLIIGIVWSIIHPFIGAFFAEIICEIRNWAYFGKCEEWGSSEKTGFGVFWPVSLPMFLIYYIYVAIINRAFLSK